MLRRIAYGSVMGLLETTSLRVHTEAYGLVVAGIMLLLGFIAHMVGRRVHIPRVTLLMLMGFLASPSVFNLVSPEVAAWFPLATHIALGMVGFQLGERFLGKKLRHIGTTILAVSLAGVAVTSGTVIAVLLLGGVSLPMAFLLAGVAPATAPASTFDVVDETKAKGPVTDTVLGAVLCNNAWTVILFSIVLVVAQITGGKSLPAHMVAAGMAEVVGAVLLGGIVGLPMAWLTGRVQRGELTVVETLGFVFLCSGLAIGLGLSPILACMAMGAVVSNLAAHHERPFHAIEEVEQPFLIVFFTLAGFHFNIAVLRPFVSVGLMYIVARSAGMIAGGGLGAHLAGAPRTVRTHTGWCLLPQAGVALGLGLKASEQYPEFGGEMLSIVVATTVVMEFVGPIITRFALRHAGEAT